MENQPLPHPPLGSEWLLSRSHRRQTVENSPLPHPPLGSEWLLSRSHRRQTVENSPLPHPPLGSEWLLTRSHRRQTVENQPLPHPPLGSEWLLSRSHRRQTVENSPLPHPPLGSEWLRLITLVQLTFNIYQSNTMRVYHSLVLACTVWCLTSVLSAAELSLASIFSDHMVLQRDRAVSVWGTCDPQQTVELEFKGQKKSAKADANGRWIVELDALSADGNGAPLKATLKSAPDKVVTLQDVVVGDVWLASGQSNMEWEMQWKPDSKDDIAKANHPQLRLIQVPLVATLKPQNSISASWSRCTPESVASFSAVGYYFGLKIHQDVQVPVGIIQSAWGGTRIEPWTDPSGFAATPALVEFGKSVVAQLPGSADYQNKYNEYFAQTEQWLKDARTAVQAGDAAPPLPAQPAAYKADPGTPTALYNAMIHPLAPFGIKGAIWYQGESNHNEGFAYVDKTEALLHSWRKAFKNPTLPFYYVQIAPWQYGDEDPEIIPQFWVAQQQCQKLPHTGMAVITDLGEIPDIHPAQKKEVARRLALWALAKDYGMKDIDPSGPTYASHKVDGNAIQVRFDHTRGGLMTRDGKAPSHFEVAGVDGQFVPATAKLAGADSVIVSSDKVPAPKQVRFAWSKLAIPNLANGDKLQATAFHTHWPVDPDLGDNLAKNCSFQSSDANPWGWDVGLTDGVWAMLRRNVSPLP